MLKIKDEVNLKELEKFGFKHHKPNPYSFDHYAVVVKTKYLMTQRLLIAVFVEDREIWVYDKKGLDILFEMIQSGLIEKVVEE